MVGITMGIPWYNTVEQEMVKLGAEQSAMAAQIAVSVTDGDLVEALEPGCEDTKGYQTVLTAL